MCKNLIILLLILTIHSISYSQSEKLEGTWEGKTSQDYVMTMKVQMVEGIPMITSYKYEIKLRGTSYSQVLKTFKMRTIKITEGIFVSSNKHSQGLNVFADYISGIFKANKVEGSISESHNYPFDKAKNLNANVTYTLSKIIDSIK